MAVKEKAVSKGAGGGSAKAADSPMVAEFFKATPYKRNQGRTVRLVTAAVIGIIVALSAWRLNETLVTASPGLQWIVPGVLLAAGMWIAYRAIHIPKFAEFLIAVEAEMSKVSWPTKTELIRSSAVVIIFIIALAGILFMFDLFWRTVFQFLGVI